MIVSLMAPLPMPAQTAPALVLHVHSWLAMPSGIGSLMTVPSAGTLPPLITVTVYSIVPPTATVCRSAVLVICSCGVELPVTDAVHGGAFNDAAFACEAFIAAAFMSTPHTPSPDGVTVAVLVMDAGGALLTVAVTV